MLFFGGGGEGGGKGFFFIFANGFAGDLLSSNICLCYSPGASHPTGNKTATNYSGFNTLFFNILGKNGW